MAEWELHAFYHAAHYPRLDAVIIDKLRAARIRKDYDSGMGFGTRDLFFRFRSKMTAQKVQRLLRGIRHLKTELVPFDRNGL